MTLRWMYDASTPPASPPKLYCAAGYIGGDTPHVWTPEEWAAQIAPFRLPIFTASDRADDACAAGEDAWAIANELGRLGVPPGVTVAVDIETRVYKTYLAALNQFVRRWLLMAYGSLSTLLSNPATSGGRWAADWTGNIQAGLDQVGINGIHALQWADAAQLGRPYDLSVISPQVPLWPR